MTKAELEKEAEEKASVYFNSLDIDNGNVSDTPFSAYDVFVAYEKGALEFAEPREKRIAELEAQIEKMKRDVMRNVKWADQNKNEQMYCKLNAMINQWEIKEK